MHNNIKAGFHITFSSWEPLKSEKSHLNSQLFAILRFTNPTQPVEWLSILSDQNRLLNDLRATENAVELHTFISLIHSTLVINTLDDIIQIFRCLTIVNLLKQTTILVYLLVRMYSRRAAEWERAGIRDYFPIWLSLMTLYFGDVTLKCALS